MKRIVINAAILIVGLILLGAIIYAGQYVTQLRMKNRALIQSLNTIKRDSQDLSKILQDPMLSNQMSDLRKRWEEIALLLPKIKSDVELKNNLFSLGENLDKIQNGAVLEQIIKNSDEPLKPLLDLKKNLIFLEQYNFNWAKDLQYQADNWLSFLGYDKPKNYLVVFQATKIPRPTGGYLGNYGILTLNKGKISISGQNIFYLDNVFLDKIIPPYPLQFISNKWFFHDANWFFDFPTTCKKLTEFYQNTGLQPEINGVIAINDSVLEPLINISGPIELKYYNLILDAGNFSSFFEKQIRDSVQAISPNGEREIFSVFIEALYNKLSISSSDQYFKIQDTFKTLLRNKDIQLYSADDKVEYYFDSLNWAGKITESKNDYLAVVFSGIEKKFNFDKRQKIINLKTQIATSTAENILTIKAPLLTKGDNNLETYLKIYLPKDVNILNASGGHLKTLKPNWPYDKLGYQIDADIQNQENKKIIDDLNGIEIYEESLKTVVATWANLSARPFSLTYQLPVSTSDITGWELKVQKQSGQNIKFSYNLNVPFGKQLSPTLFEFNKYLPLTQDLLLNFQIN